jgi:membrane protein DedA with SNARE-associated domain
MVDGSQQVAADTKEILNESVDREKRLRVRSRFEPPHLSLALPRGLMRRSHVWPVRGAAVTLSAMWVTACIQFLLARRLGGERLRKRLGDQLGRIGLLLERRGALAVAGGRLLPGPFSELNMAAGLTPLTLRDFEVGTLLGCAPKAAAWSAVGAALG